MSAVARCESRKAWAGLDIHCLGREVLLLAVVRIAPASTQRRVSSRQGARD
jgi:hypothetical protein